MIRVFARLIKNLIGRNHVINHVTLGDFLGPELLRGRQIFSIIVSKMVVGGDTNWLNTGIYQKVNQNRFNFSLSRLEIVSGNIYAFTFGKLDATRNKGVLW